MVVEANYDVLHINSYFQSSTVHFELVRSLDERGLRQLVFLPLRRARGQADNSQFLIGSSVVNVVRCYGSLERLIWPLKIARAWSALKKAHKESPARIVHAHTLLTNGILAWMLWRKYRIPYVVTVRNTDTDFFLKKFPFLKGVARKILNNAEKVIVLSPIYRDVQLPKYFDKVERFFEKVEVIPSGVNERWFTDLGSERTVASGRLVFVGKLDKNKNLDCVLGALARLRDKGKKFSLEVVGDGPMRKELEASASGLNVCFYGHIEELDSLISVLRAADILVVPSLRETFGLVYVEAMTQGLPVIYSRGQGFDGFFKDGEIGMPVMADSAEDVAGAIEKISDSLNYMSRAALNRVSRFRWQQVSADLERVYRS